MRYFLGLLCALLGTTTVAQVTSVPHTFQSGTPAIASEVNENFSALADGIINLEGVVTGTSVVNCSGGGSISQVLASGRRSIEFTGICVEAVDISTSGVTLTGSGLNRSENVVEGDITITGATGVVLSHFTVDGTNIGGAEVAMHDGAFATLTDMHLINATQEAIQSSGAHVVNSLIQGTGADQSMEAFRDSFIRIDGTVVERSTGDPTISIGANSTFIATGGQSEIKNADGVNALNIIRVSVAELDTVDLVGSLIVSRLSGTTIGSASSIDGGIIVRAGSALFGDFNGVGSISVTGAIDCRDADMSSLDGAADFTAASNNCTGF